MNREPASFASHGRSFDLRPVHWDDLDYGPVLLSRLMPLLLTHLLLCLGGMVVVVLAVVTRAMIAHLRTRDPIVQSNRTLVKEP